LDANKSEAKVSKKKYLTDWRYAQVGEPSKATYTNIISSRDNKHPHASSQERAVYEQKLISNMSAYIDEGQIYYNKHKIQKIVCNLSEELGKRLDVDISSEIV